MPRLVEARYVRDFVIWVRFTDGTEGEVDRPFTLSPDLHTIVWPNGADIAPEFLHERVRIHAQGC